MTNRLLIIPIVFLMVLFGASNNVAHATNAVDTTFGKIDTPPGVTEQIAKSGLGTNEVAIFFFLSSLVKIANVLAGIWVAFNIMFAAFTYLSSQGSADAHKKVRDKLTMSVVGLLLLVVAYIAIAVLSRLLFGDAGYILKPTLSVP